IRHSNTTVSSSPAPRSRRRTPRLTSGAAGRAGGAPGRVDPVPEHARRLRSRRVLLGATAQAVKVFVGGPLAVHRGDLPVVGRARRPRRLAQWAAPLASPTGDRAGTVARPADRSAWWGHADR